MIPLKPELQPGSIRAQLLTASFVTISVVLALVIVVVLGSEYLLGRQGLTDDLRVQADMIAAQSSAAIMFSDVAAASETLASLRASPVVREAVLYDAAGEPCATYCATAGRPRICARHRPARATRCSPLVTSISTRT